MIPPLWKTRRAGGAPAPAGGARSGGAGEENTVPGPRGPARHERDTGAPGFPHLATRRNRLAARH